MQTNALFSDNEKPVRREKRLRHCLNALSRGFSIPKTNMKGGGKWRLAERALKTSTSRGLDRFVRTPNTSCTLTKYKSDNNNAVDAQRQRLSSEIYLLLPTSGFRTASSLQVTIIAPMTNIQLGVLAADCSALCSQ
jgi:hypothetical protein